MVCFGLLLVFNKVSQDQQILQSDALPLSFTYRAANVDVLNVKLEMNSNILGQSNLIYNFIFFFFLFLF